MSERNTGGPAFPQVELDRVTGNPCDQHFGMTLRDYFAAKAMTVIRQTAPNCLYTDIAKYAYEMADAMLKARK